MHSNRISLFVTCLTDTFYPRVGRAVVLVLEHLGYDVDFPAEQTCCGQPMWNSGCHKDAGDLARRMVDVFDDAGTVITPSGSCAAMIRDYYGDLLKDDARYEQRVRVLCEKTQEFVEFLTKTANVDLRDLGCAWPPDGGPMRVTYHYSCHLRGIGMTDEAVHLLRQIDGIEYVPLEKMDQCCGFGGTFAVKCSEISGAMVRDKVGCIAATGAPVVVCNDGGCTMNIAGSAHREGVNVRFKHIAEIIAEGLGLLEPEPATI